MPRKILLIEAEHFSHFVVSLVILCAFAFGGYSLEKTMSSDVERASVERDARHMMVGQSDEPSQFATIAPAPAAAPAPAPE